MRGYAPHVYFFNKLDSNPVMLNLVSYSLLFSLLFYSSFPLLFSRAKEVSCSEDCTMVLTEENKVLIWGKGFYGRRVENSVPVAVEANTIIDVTTCSVWCGSVFTELVFALTKAKTLLLCGAGRSGLDFQAFEATVPCNRDGLVSITSVGSVLVAVDSKGVMHYAESQTWLKNVITNEGASLPTDLPHVLCSAHRKLKSSNTGIPQLTWKTCTLPDTVSKVEATLDTFFFSTTVGDVCSWKPFSGGNILRHTELDNVIIIDIACGMQHVAILTEEGEVLTCGSGFSGQLGNGTFESIYSFHLVPLTESIRVSMICCGLASTAVLTRTGKVISLIHMRI